MKIALKSLLFLLVLFSVSSALAKTPASTWDSFQFLMGEWQGAEGIYSIGSEHFSFAFDLQSRVIVQKIHGSHPAVLGNPAFTTDGLMVIYAEQATPTPRLRADYFDSHGNVMHYAVEVSSDSEAVTFVGADALGHRFRTTYSRRKDGALDIKTMMAEPGREEFTLMNEGAAYKK